MASTVGARLTNDGTLYVNRPSPTDQTLDDGFDEVSQDNISITRLNVFAYELCHYTKQSRI